MCPVPSRLRPAPRRRSLLALGAIAPLLIAATPALAADAPLRTINRDPAGNPAQNVFSTYVSDDGREVISNANAVGVLLRDVAAGTSTQLLPSTVVVRGASRDGRYLLGETSANGVIPGDTDGEVDAFFYDRQTGTTTNASRDLPNFLDGTRAVTWSRENLQLSGDGRYLTYELALQGLITTAAPVRRERSLWRADRATGRTVRLRSLPATFSTTSVSHTDVAGSVAIGGTSAWIGSRRIDLPSTSSVIAISSSGETIAVQAGPTQRDVTLISAATGAITGTVQVPADVALSSTWLLDVAGDGAAIWLRTTERATFGSGRERMLRVSASGAATILGEYPLFEGASSGQLSENHAFAANGQYLVQLGSLPLPGVEPPAATTDTLQTWLPYVNTSCARNFWGQVSWIRATVSLSKVARGFDPRTPASAIVKVFKTGAPTTIYNQFSLAAGAQRQLTVPNTGGWTVSATVTFTDGTTYTGSYDVPVRIAPRC